MATAKNTAPARTRQRRVIEDAPERVAVQMKSDIEKASEAAAAASGQVIVSVPKAFKLTRDGHVPVEYGVGTQRMPRLDAEHWYSKVMGVTIFSPAEDGRIPH